MSDLYGFMSSNPFLTFFLAVGICEVLIAVLYRLLNRIMRHWNIRKNGYPPEYCDADGDFKPKDKARIIIE